MTADPQIRERNAQELREGRALVGVLLTELTAVAGGCAAGIDPSSAAPLVAAPMTIGLTFLFSHMASKGAVSGIEPPGHARSLSRIVMATIFSSALCLGFFSYVVTASNSGKSAGAQNQAQINPHP